MKGKEQINGQRKEPLSLLIKPASGLCNLRCDYCFYREEVAHLQDFHQKIMSDETMDLLIQRAFESAGGQVQ
ncbi:MAG: hypothetical protein LUF30_08805, partial [Lachnospiraceae bacterium]|nr:hypothetical protein [Lachnospiraceae bacterium]